MTDHQSERDAEVGLPFGFIEDVGATTTLTELLDVASAWLETVVECDRSSITMLSEPDRDRLQLHAVGDKTVLADPLLFGFDDSLVGMAYSERQLVSFGDIGGMDFKDAQRLVNHGITSVLVAPLISAGQAFGTLNLGRFRAGRFSKQDELGLRSVASLLGPSLSVHRQIAREQRAARRDHLTGLLNRRAILEVLNDAIKSPGREEVSVLFFDLDGFKSVNDTHGHATGDALLVEVGRRLSAHMRGGDQIGRLGGDEFLAICTAGSFGEPAEAIAERMVVESMKPFIVGRTVLRPRVSVGVSALTRATQTTAGLLAEADYAMYQAKQSRESVVVIDAQLRAENDLVVAVDRDIEGAIRNDQLGFEFQAVHSLTTGEMLGAEALLRWNHPVHGPISPTIALERIESAGLIEDFTHWSLEAIGRQWSWLQNEVPNLSTAVVSLNLNPSQIGLDSYSDWHLEMIERFSMDRGSVMVEVVESEFGELTEGALSTLRRLADSGVLLSLDDFGACFNAFSYFTRFPIHTVKFDRLLVGGMADDPDLRRLVFGIAHIANDFDFTVVAEGVESQSEVDLLLEMGVDRGQGRLLSPPMVIEQLASYETNAQKANAHETNAHETNAHETNAHETNADETTGD